MNIIEKEQFSLVGLLKSCEEHKLNIEIPKLFTIMNERRHEIVNRLNDKIVDICLEVKNHVYKQIIGYEVDNVENVPNEMTIIIIPKQKYLYYKHKGPSYEIYDAFVSMYDYAIQNHIVLDETEFKIEVYNEEQQEYDLYLKLK